ncbi:type 1 glutamine amidotransferase domain-containing protein [Aquiflexum sp. TKW24L]|uniref:type 1 glutamine amidotransferase domain-containing protein n=1 Tax=Aquiflexum sp. TKW24L TaxID=2942212 RepID=UPI0020BE4CA5|nr:type 1 glutamine amidotransferase domain-containing protein [Aquiflexum sp. TKW24L]MCL6261099.1 type 1 glutamine amidotransferase domain-containing protein [Aquiflexum sp. TKW24L]
MSRTNKFVKWSLIGVAGIIVLLVAFGWWIMSLVAPPDPSAENLPNVLPNSLSYLTENPVLKRGKILAVVTSAGSFESTGKKTGYELTELSLAYYVFEANGFEVDIASPQGGEPPMVLDDEDMGAFDYAFLNDPLAQRKAKSTIVMDSVNIEEYDAIYFVGGKGAMFDFPESKAIQQAIQISHEKGKVIGAICHGPAALVNVKLNDGTFFLKGRKVSSFTNREELFLIKDARDLFPFLLQDKLIENGALFSEGAMYLENVIADGNLITGQNPWSTWGVAEAMIKQLGYEPKKRQKTDAENAVLVLNAYEKQGYKSAKKVIEDLKFGEKELINRNLIAMHAVVSAMRWEISKGFGIIGLLWHAKSLS